MSAFPDSKLHTDVPRIELQVDVNYAGILPYLIRDSQIYNSLILRSAFTETLVSVEGSDYGIRQIELANALIHIYNSVGTLNRGQIVTPITKLDNDVNYDINNQSPAYWLYDDKNDEVSPLPSLLTTTARYAVEQGFDVSPVDSTQFTVTA